MEAMSQAVRHPGGEVPRWADVPLERQAMVQSTPSLKTELNPNSMYDSTYKCVAHEESAAAVCGAFSMACWKTIELFQFPWNESPDPFRLRKFEMFPCFVRICAVEV